MTASKKTSSQYLTLKILEASALTGLALLPLIGPRMLSLRLEVG